MLQAEVCATCTLLSGHTCSLHMARFCTLCCSRLNVKGLKPELHLRFMLFNLEAASKLADENGEKSVIVTPCFLNTCRCRH